MTCKVIMTKSLICPHCNGNLKAKPFTLGTSLGLEIMMWSIAGMLFLLGMLWVPAFFIGGAFGIFVVLKKPGYDKYECNSCGKSVLFKDLS